MMGRLQSHHHHHHHSYGISYCSIGDMCDEDMDGDGFPNEEDNCPTKPNRHQVDKDGDEFGDDCDNCPKEKNPDQTDENQNLIGDICEQGEDADGDGFFGINRPAFSDVRLS